MNVEPPRGRDPSPEEQPELPGMIVEDMSPFFEHNLWWTRAMVALHLKTTERTIARWVADGRLQRPTKFGRLARWPKELIERIAKEGIPGLDTGYDEASRIIGPLGVEVDCPCCAAKLRVGRKGKVVVLAVPPPVAEVAAKPARKPRA